MTRRLTMSGCRGEMGLPADFHEPQSPPPSWTPAKHETFWNRKPSKWQICMPRLRFVAKVILSSILLVVLFKILGQQPSSPTSLAGEQALPQPPGEVPEEELKEPTEEEMLGRASREEWLWKNFET